MKAIVVSLAFLLTASPIHAAPPESVSTVQQRRPAPADIQVWVNTASKVYHCPGSRWYGNTKRGEYMTQAQAKERGHRPAYKRECR